MTTPTSLLAATLLAVSLTGRLTVPVRASPTAPVEMESSSPAARLLLPQATRLFPIDGSFQKGGVEQPWLSPHELLHFKGGQLCRYDLTTKSDTSLPALTRQVVDSPAYLDFVEASPDGQWALWGASSNNPIFVAPLDGKQRLSWPGYGGMGEPYWCADGHHWLQVLFGMKGFSFSHPKVNYTGALLHDADVPQHTETLTSLPPGLNGLDVLRVVSDTEVVARTPDPTTVGPSKPVPNSGGNEFTFESKPTFRATQQISVWDLRQRAPLHQWTLRLPGQVQELAVSPQGDRVAWLIGDWMQTARGRSGRFRTCLWVSGLDGGGLREVGYVDATVDMAAIRHMSVAQMEGYSPPLPMQPNWSPDGMQVSFLCQGVLWAVPVP